MYKENYQTLPMKHAWIYRGDKLDVSYSWKTDRWHHFSVTTEAISRPIMAGSEEEFITEHYWGYTAIGNGRSSEYEVVHPRWEVYQMLDYSIVVGFNSTYGSTFAFLQHQQPVSVFLAEGSAIAVKAGRLLPNT